jgi:microcystin-dependent protein
LGFGTWAQIQDRMIVGAGNKYSYGATGGAATHTLTIDEMPSHTHTVKGFNSSCDSASGRSSYGWNTSGSSVTSSSTGNGKAFSIMPPYFAVYMWYRTS